MLRITVPGCSESVFWDEQTENFIILPAVKEQTLQLEHSLISLWKWESKWGKAYHGKKEKTTEETLDYIRCMTITPNVDPRVYENLSEDNLKAIYDYILAPMSAVYFPEEGRGTINNETVTADLIYYWMITLNIPFEPCEKWHLNRLIALIRVCCIKNAPKDKKGMTSDKLAARKKLMAERRAKRKSKG